LADLNRAHLAERDRDSQLEASIESMEIAFRMQTEVPEAFDIRKESEATRARYGNGNFGRGCLMALRLIERGVRMVQIYYGDGQPWDNHDDILIHKKLARDVDAPAAALLEDLKARGLFEETLVILGTEFGRTPAVEISARVNVQNGRDHNPYGYSVLLAGGGINGGMTYGATDETSLRRACTRNSLSVPNANGSSITIRACRNTRPSLLLAVASAVVQTVEFLILRNNGFDHVCKGLFEKLVCFSDG
jgi:uncharacterized protein (DUF1501 family)